MSTTPTPDFEVRDIFAMAGTTDFTVIDRRYNRHLETKWSFARVALNREARVSLRTHAGEVTFYVADMALDQVIEAMVNLRDARDAEAWPPVGLAEPLVEDEPYDPRVSADLGGAFLNTVINDPAAARDAADLLDEHRGDSTDDGQVAA